MSAAIELLRAIFAQVPADKPSADKNVPDTNGFDVRVTVGDLKFARWLIAAHDSWNTEVTR